MSSGVDGLRRSNSRFHLRLKTSEGMKGVRINFLREVQSANETRTGVVEMVRAAEAKT
jgi:hypothetical protein